MKNRAYTSGTVIINARSTHPKRINYEAVVLLQERVMIIVAPDSSRKEIGRVMSTELQTVHKLIFNDVLKEESAEHRAEFKKKYPFSEWEIVSFASEDFRLWTPGPNAFQRLFPSRIYAFYGSIESTSTRFGSVSFPFKGVIIVLPPEQQLSVDLNQRHEIIDRIKIEIKEECGRFWSRLTSWRFTVYICQNATINLLDEATGHLTPIALDSVKDVVIKAELKKQISIQAKLKENN